jgi:hypothetical protein
VNKMKIGDVVQIDFDPAGLPFQGVVEGFQTIKGEMLVLVGTGVGPLVVPVSMVAPKVGYTVGEDHDDSLGGTQTDEE